MISLLCSLQALTLFRRGSHHGPDIRCGAVYLVVCSKLCAPFSECLGGAGANSVHISPGCSARQGHLNAHSTCWRLKSTGLGSGVHTLLPPFTQFYTRLWCRLRRPVAPDQCVTRLSVCSGHQRGAHGFALQVLSPRVVLRPRALPLLSSFRFPPLRSLWTHYTVGYPPPNKMGPGCGACAHTPSESDTLVFPVGRGVSL